MKLDDFLKCKKVRAIRNYGESLTEGKEYMISSVDYISVSDNDGDTACLDSDLFEPVLEPAENPEQGVELTPEFEAVEPVLADNSEVNIQDIDTNILDTNADIKDTPKFKVRDKVYFGVNPKIQTIESLHAYDNIKFIGTWGCAHAKQCCHATPENYERLQATFPDIEFEQPPKPLTGSDLARAMLDKGWVSVPCYISDESDYEADNNAFCALIGKFDKCFKELATNYEHEYAVPFDPRTGEPLTQAVLDE